MKTSYHSLPLYRLERGIRPARPKQQLPRRISADDPALSVMTDLCQISDDRPLSNHRRDHRSIDAAQQGGGFDDQAQSPHPAGLRR